MWYMFGVLLNGIDNFVWCIERNNVWCINEINWIWKYVCFKCVLSL